MKKIKEILIDAFQGFCMALADSVPGVSGGSIAFLMGFYDEFISSLASFTSRSKTELKKGISFLIKLGIGWVIGMALSSRLLSSVFETHIYEVSSLFLGFIVVATLLLFKEPELKKGWNFQRIIAVIIGAAIVILTVVLRNVGGGMSYDITHLNVGLCFYIFIAAMCAISAMVLPGISGSTILLVFGLYLPVIKGISAATSGDFSSVPGLLIFICGVIFGILFIVHWIKIGLDKHPAVMKSAIVGMMIGSFYAIVMGPTTLETPKQMMTIHTFSIPFFIIGIVLVVLLEFYRSRKEKKQGENL